LVLVAACFYSKFNLEKYSKIDVSSFWHDLGFGGSSFYSNLNEKNIQKLFFPAFGTTFLVLVAASFYSKFKQKIMLQN